MLQNASMPHRPWELERPPSRDRPGHFEFKLGRGQVIRGWDAGVATMHKGEVAVLTAREDYAYGKRGMPPDIPPNATLTASCATATPEPADASIVPAANRAALPPTCIAPSLVVSTLTEEAVSDAEPAADPTTSPVDVSNASPLVTSVLPMLVTYTAPAVTSAGKLPPLRCGRLPRQ